MPGRRRRRRVVSSRRHRHRLAARRRGSHVRHTTMVPDAPGRRHQAVESVANATQLLVAARARAAERVQRRALPPQRRGERLAGCRRDGFVFVTCAARDAVEQTLRRRRDDGGADDGVGPRSFFVRHGEGRRRDPRSTRARVREDHRVGEGGIARTSCRGIFFFFRKTRKRRGRRRRRRHDVVGFPTTFSRRRKRRLFRPRLHRRRLRLRRRREDAPLGVLALDVPEPARLLLPRARHSLGALEFLGARTRELLPQRRGGEGILPRRAQRRRRSRLSRRARSNRLFTFRDALHERVALLLQNRARVRLRAELGAQRRERAAERSRLLRRRSRSRFVFIITRGRRDSGDVDLVEVDVSTRACSRVIVFVVHAVVYVVRVVAAIDMYSPRRRRDDGFEPTRLARRRRRAAVFVAEKQTRRVFFFGVGVGVGVAPLRVSRRERVRARHRPREPPQLVVLLAQVLDPAARARELQKSGLFRARRARSLRRRRRLCHCHRHRVVILLGRPDGRPLGRFAPRAFAARKLEIGVSPLRALEARAELQRLAPRRGELLGRALRRERMRITPGDAESRRRPRGGRGAARPGVRHARRADHHRERKAVAGARAPRESEGDETPRGGALADLPFRAPDSTSQVPDIPALVSVGRFHRSRRVTETGGKRRNLEKKVDGPDPEARPSSVRAALLTDATGPRYHAPPCSSASRPCPRGAFPGSRAPREPSSRESLGLRVPNGAFHAAPFLGRDAGRSTRGWPPGFRPSP